MSAETKINELGLDLNYPPAPVANYIGAVRSGSLVFLAGHGPLEPGEGGKLRKGKLGDGMSVEEGYDAARLVGVNLLATLRREVGDLNRVKRVVKAFVMVNSTGDFGQHPQVANGFSDLMVEVFGDAGKHARSAVGMASLPMGIPVETEMIVEVD